MMEALRMAGLCGEPSLFWELPDTLQYPVYPEGPHLHTARLDRCREQTFCVTVVSPLWDPGFANTVAPALVNTYLQEQTQSYTKMVGASPRVL